MLSIVRTTFVVIAVTLLVGCPNKRKIAAPEPPVPRNGDQDALRRFEESQAQFRQGQGDDGSAATVKNFERIAREYPNDPIVPHALLYAGMSAVNAGEWAIAIENLDQLIANADAEDALITRGLFYRGLAKNYSRDFQSAISDLKEGKGSVGTLEGEKEEYLAAMAMAHVGVKRYAQALSFFDEWHKSARESEKAFIEVEVGKSAELMVDAELDAAYVALASKDGPAAAYLGRRLIASLRTRGEMAKADEIASNSEGARKRFGLQSVVGGDGLAGEPDRVGGILPLTGRSNRIGDKSGRGLSLAASFAANPGRGADSGWPKRFSLRLRDSGSEADRATRMLDELAAEDVIAVIGPVDRSAVKAITSKATEIAMPVVTLSQRPKATDSPYVFHIFHSASRRAELLARHAYSKGVRDFAIMKPKNGYGRVVGAAFADEVERLGGNVIVTVSYGTETTSFRSTTNQLKKPWQAIFVADTAKRLELIAPSLAVANFVPRPRGKSGRGRSIMLLSTAESLSDTLITSAGVHVWGAVFAPGFYADQRDSRIGDFVDRYTKEFGRAPNAIDAYAFDAALVIRDAVENGAENRAQVAKAIAETSLTGLTGKIRFDPATHKRQDGGVLFSVDQLSSGSYAIRTLR